jgi:putative sterol carrier protein
VQNFLNGLPLVLQRGQSKAIDANYHFTFTGREERKATVVIRDQRVEVSDGHVGRRDILVTADTATWLGFVSGERNLVWTLLRRKIRIRGSARLLLSFARCFPS